MLFGSWKSNNVSLWIPAFNFIPFCIFLCLFFDSIRSNNHGRISESSSGDERNLNCWDFEWMRKLKITRKIFLFTRNISESISREIFSRMLLGFITRTESLSFQMSRDKNVFKISNVLFVSYLCLSSTSQTLLVKFAALLLLKGFHLHRKFLSSDFLSKTLDVPGC